MTLDTTSFDLHRSLPLPPDRLWQVLTEPQHRDKWGAPDPETILVTERSDVRVGGEDRQRSGPADAPEFFVDTRWYDLAGPDRAVYTETLIFGGEAVCTSLVTCVLTPEGAGTKLSLTVAVSSFSGAETLDEVHKGWDAWIGQSGTLRSDRVRTSLNATGGWVETHPTLPKQVAVAR